jgi:hypothetical protein
MARTRVITFGQLLILLAILSSALSAVGQTVSQAPVQTVEDVLRQFSDKAGVVFVGQVLEIHRLNDQATASGTVEVRFRVDQAILGCAAGAPYVLREWGGLWAADSHRYHIGQRLLMFLYAPNAFGISSPVNGLDGAIPIRQGGTAIPSLESATLPSSPYVDLRWLGARLQRTVAYRQTSVSPTHTKRHDLPTVLVAPSYSRVNVIPITATSAQPSSSQSSVPAQQASLNFVLSILTTWQKVPHATP